MSDERDEIDDSEGPLMDALLKLGPDEQVPVSPEIMAEIEKEWPEVAKLVATLADPVVMRIDVNDWWIPVGSVDEGLEVGIGLHAV